ncbi:hypothetical protein Tco_1049276, partial [Tanacetum coccineum]
VVWEVIETRLVVEAVRRFATRRFVTSLSLSMLSPNLAKDSSMVGGVDGLDDGVEYTKVGQDNTCIQGRDNTWPWF